MPAVLEKDKAKTSKPEAFVEKQIEQARGRIRSLDFFQTGLLLLIAVFVMAFALLLVDRAYETPRGTIWALIAVFALGSCGYVWYALFRPSRRHINPFYAAQQVEHTIPDAKNSVINYIDLEDDTSVPASVKASIGARAAKDIKQVDLNRAIQKKQILWLAVAAGLTLIAAIVAALLPPTRTTMKLLSPSEGNTTVVLGENVTFKVELNGRIPEKTEPDAARVRIWYNPEDPGNFEERLLDPVEGESGVFGYVLPAKQVRNGFWYQIFAGNVKTPAYEVKLRIVPQFTGIWEVEYSYPDYLNKPAEKKSDPKLVGYYNTEVTLTAHANRPVRSAKLHMQLDGQSPSIDNIPVANDPEAIRFKFPLTRNGRYQISFVTTEGHKNPDPQWYTISLVDPLPVIRFFDVTYDYPKYLRYERTSVVLREPNLEVNCGTEVTLVANANRPVKAGHLDLNGSAIAGELVEKQPTQVKFKLPALMKDGVYRVWFTPATGEADSRPSAFTIRVISDDHPKVDITNPQQQVSEVPANGSLPVEGIATDDHGLARMNLRFEVVSPAPNRPLSPKPYRGGMSFQRKEDNSYPTRIEFKDIIELAKLKADGANAAGFSVEPGMEIEFWLEAIDNCDVPPGPNSSISRKLRIRVMQPEMNPDRKKQQDKERQAFEQEKKQHEAKQDQKNANEKRDPNQPKQRDDQQQQGGMGEPGGEPGQPDKKADPKGGGMGQPTMDPNNMGGDPAAAEELKAREDELKKALNKVDPMGGMKTEPKSDPGAKEPKKEEPKDPKKDEPKDPMKGDPKAKKEENGKQAESKPEEKPDPRQMPKPEDVQKLADKLNSKDMKEREEAREQIKKAMEQAKNDQRKPDEAQKDFDEHRKNLDDAGRKQFDQSLERVAQEMKDIEREKRVNDAVDKITNGNKEQREQGQRELENELRDPKSGKDTERQLQNLAGDMGSERKKQIGDAMNLARENMNKPTKNTPPEAGPMPKEKEPEPEEEDVDRLAKKSKDGNKDEKKQAQEDLEKMLRNPATRDKVQKQLEDYKNKIKDRQEREEFEKTLNDIAENAKKNMDPDQRRAEEIKKLAEQLKSENQAERDAAQKQLEEALKQADKDPKAQANAEKQLKDARDSIKDPKQQERFDQAVKDIKDAVEKHRQEKAAAEKKLQDDLKDIAKGLNDKDPAKQQEAQRKLEEKLKDPETREQVKDQLDKLKQNTGDNAAKENVEKATEKALDDINRKERFDKVANDLNSKEPERQQAAKERIEDMLADPKSREQVKKDLDKLKEAMKDQEAKDKLDKAVADAEKNIARNKQEAEQIANDLSSKDPAKQKAAQEKLEEALKDPARREQVKNELDRIGKEANEPGKKEKIEKAAEKAADNIARQKELERIANDLNSKDEDRKRAAQQRLENKLADPKEGEQVKKDLEKVKEGLKNQQAKDKVDDAVEQAERNIAQNRKDAAQVAKDLTGKDKPKSDAAQQKLEDLLNDPAKRDQIKNELERLKRELGDDQAKVKIDEAIQKAEDKLAGKGKSGEPKKEDLERIARDLNSKDADKQKAAQQELRDALKDRATREKVEKDFNDIKDKLADAGEKQKLVDALNKAKEDLAKLDKPLDPKEIEKLVKDLKSKDPKTAADAQKKLDELLDDPDMREKLAQAIEELMKNLKDETAKKEFDDSIREVKDRMAKLDAKAPTKTGAVKLPDGKTAGQNTTEPEKETTADLKNKIKSGELLLEKFRRNIDNEEFRKQLGWTDEQMREFLKQYEQQLAQLKKQLDYELKGEIPPREKGGSSSLNDAGAVKRDPLDGSDPLRSGRGIAPPGFGDAYEKFTTEVSGVERKVPPPPGK